MRRFNYVPEESRRRKAQPDRYIQMHCIIYLRFGGGAGCARTPKHIVLFRACFSGQLGSAALGGRLRFARLGPGSTQLGLGRALLRLAWLSMGGVGLGSPRLGMEGLGSARQSSARYGPARLDSARQVSGRLGPSRALSTKSGAQSAIRKQIS